MFNSLKMRPRLAGDRFKAPLELEPGERTPATFVPGAG
jgi:hypothetical protein